MSMFATAAAAVRTCNFLLYLEFLGSACEDVFERQPYLYSQVAALMSLCSSASASAKVKSEASASAEDVTEGGEDIIDVGEASEASTTSEASRAIHALFAKLVVASAFVGVMEHIVSLCGFFEFFLGLLVARVAVRMIFDGDTLIGFFDFFGTGIFVNAENFVIAFFCHNFLLLSDFFIVRLRPLHGAALYR